MTYWIYRQRAGISRERAGSDCRQQYPAVSCQLFQGGLSGAPRIGEGSVRRAASRWTSGAGRGLSAHHSCGATRVYDRYYHSNNCSIYLSGKVTGDCIHRIESLFGCEGFRYGFRKPEKTEFHPVTTSGKRIFIERPDAPAKCRPYGHGLSLDRNHPDYLKARVLVTLFGGYFGSRLMSNIREDKGYTYGISAAIMPYPGQGVLAVSAEAANEFVEPLIGEVYHEIDRLQNELASDGELSMVKNYMLGDMCRSYESAFSLGRCLDFYAGIGLAGYLLCRSTGCCQ